MKLPPLAVRIRQLRLARKLTLEQLAADAGVSRSTIAKIEAGDTPDPGYSVVVRLIAATSASDSDVLALHRETLGDRQPHIFGIGYQGLELPSLIQDLRRRHVATVADVRLTPLSRKKGLSKTALREGLALANIDYIHLPALGNPKQNRLGYGDPTNREPREAFRSRLRSPAAEEQLDVLRALSVREVVAVLCFESDERTCHREQVLDAIGRTTSWPTA